MQHITTNTLNHDVRVLENLKKFLSRLTTHDNVPLCQVKSSRKKERCDASLNQCQLPSLHKLLSTHKELRLIAKLHLAA